MKTTISENEAREILQKYLHEPYLLAHSRESEIIMRALARHFGEDEELWGLTGLLHDLDMEQTKDNIPKHGERTCELLMEEGYDLPEMFRAIKSHCENLGYLGVKRESKLDYSLSAAENLTGLIVAYTLMRPDKKMAGVEVSSLIKKFKDKSFAAKVNRQFIEDIEKTGLSRDEFLQMALDAMKKIAGEFGF